MVTVTVLFKSRTRCDGWRGRRRVEQVAALAQPRHFIRRQRHFTTWTDVDAFKFDGASWSDHCFNKFFSFGHDQNTFGVATVAQSEALTRDGMTIGEDCIMIRRWAGSFSSQVFGAYGMAV